jgi:hypothetical protein
MWSPDLETTRDFAHEIGHLMGFGDDYANGEPLPGREGTLMDSGDLIDQNLVNRFADIARHSGQQLPECWDGKVTGTSMQPGCTPATVPVTGEVALSVKADGSVTGSSTERRGAFSCGGAPAPAFDVDYEITGRKTASAFELSIQGTPVTLPIVGDTATTTIEHVNGGFGVSVTYTVTCRTCSEET